MNVRGLAPIPSSVPDDRLDQVRTRYVQPDPSVEGFEEFYYADTGEVIPPDDAVAEVTGIKPDSQRRRGGRFLERIGRRLRDDARTPEPPRSPSGSTPSVTPGRAFPLAIR